MKLKDTGAPIKIGGPNIDLGEALPHKVREELLRLVETYSRRLNHASVGFVRDGHWYRCTINAQVGNLKVIVAEASAADCHQAFDQALAKTGRQLHRRKHRMIDAGRREVAGSAFT